MSSPEQLGARHDDTTKRCEDEDAEPKAPCAKHALLWNGHDETSFDGDLAADANGGNGLLDAHHTDQVVVAEGEDPPPTP